MGQTGSRVVSKIASAFAFGGGGGFSGEDYDDLAGCEGAALAVARFKGGTPFVYARRGSMYFDEDGDLAHEFYEEVLPKKKGGHRRMRKVNAKRLTPQGEVPYAHPRLHVDLPIIMYQG